MSDSPRRTDDYYLGMALLVAGAIIVVIKILPGALLTAVLKLWPLLLIWLGVRMIARGRTPPTGDE